MNYDYSRLPRELTELNQWVCWGWNDRPAKMPIDPHNGNGAEADSPSTWGTFEQAAARISTGQCVGVGFEFMENQGYVGIDLDTVRDPESGFIAPEALEIISDTNSYTEISPSGYGFHIFVKSSLVLDKGHRFRLPENGISRFVENKKGDLVRKKPEIEIYNMNRYFTMTGVAYIAEKPIRSIHEAAIRPFYQSCIDRHKVINAAETAEEAAKEQPANVQTAIPVAQASPVVLSDDRLLEIAARAKNGAKFFELYSGGWKNTYTSQSEADAALLMMLAFYSGKDAAQMDRLYRRSGLMRDKWDKPQSGSTWGALEIEKACALCTNVFDPRPTAEQVFGGLSIPAANGTGSVKPHDFTDTGNARIFAREYKGKAIFVTSLGWLMWDGKKWAEEGLKATPMAMALTDRMLAEAQEDFRKASADLTNAALADNDEAKEKATKAKKAASAYLKHATLSRSQPKISAIVKLAQGEMEVKADEMDAHPFLLNTQAGIVDLKSRQIYPHSPDKYCTKITACKPGERGRQIWDAFLQTISQGDEKMIGFLQQVAGMSAVGRVYDENIIIALGGGKNGKSALFNALAAVLQDYAGTIAAEILTTANRSKGAELATLKGKRLVIAAETDESARLDAAMLKQIASTDKIHAERKYKDPEDFTPSHSTILYTNHLPRVGSTDTGTWRRLVMIPFRAKIEASQEIKNYADFLTQEAGEAILSWIIEGAVNYIAWGHKLILPEFVLEAIEEYQIKNDWMSEFLDEFCEVGEGNTARARELYTAYAEWAKVSQGYARRTDAFSEELKKRGFLKCRTSQGITWRGLRLSTQVNSFSSSYYGQV